MWSGGRGRRRGREPEAHATARRRHAPHTAPWRTPLACGRAGLRPALDALTALPDLRGLAFALLLTLPARAAEPAIEFAGMMPFPAQAATAGGDAVELTGLSGVTRLAGDSWAAAIDNSDLLVTFTLALSAKGEPTDVTDVQALKLEAKHDYEDIAVCPPGLTQRIAKRFTAKGRPDPGPCVLVCEEDTPAIRGIALATGALVGAVPLPDSLRECRPNRRLESLAVESDGSLIWTANEEATAGDGPTSRAGRGTVVRLCAIPVPGGPADGNATRQYAYAVDPPHEMVTLGQYEPFSGLVAIVALGGGRLLTLERSAGKGVPPLESRIYLVDTAGGQDVSDVQRDLARREEAILKKRLLWKDAIGCNLEGLALGPALDKAGTVLVAIADNGGIGTPTQVATFRLTGLVAAPTR